MKDIRQILYTSRAKGRVDILDILEVSRHNNALDGVSGLLYSDGENFLQIIEGGHDAVEDVFARIGCDPRHEDITVLSDEAKAEKEFGYWSMADCSKSGPHDICHKLVRQRLAGISPTIADVFLNLVDE